MARGKPARERAPGTPREDVSARTGRERPDYHDEGIVLRSYRLGESDKILRLLTREHGKRSAVGKGVRKTTSRFGARLEPLTRARLHLHRGRSMDVVKQAEIVTSFQELRDDLGLFVTASSMAELADTLAAEHQPDPGLYDLVLLGLQLLKDRPADAPFAAAFFGFKVMAHAGFELMVARCAGCGAPPEGATWFSLPLGGLVCSSCRSCGAAGRGGLIMVGDGCARALEWMSEHALGEWPPEIDESVSGEAGVLMGKVLEHWMEREFRTHRVRRELP